MTLTASELKESSLDYLRGVLKPGDVVYTVMSNRTASGNGTFRVLIVDGGRIADISGHVARLTSLVFDRKFGGVKVGGGDGLDAVQALAYALYPDGFQCTGAGTGEWGTACPSNEHANERMSGKPDNYGDRFHSYPGYALRHISLN